MDTFLPPEARALQAALNATQKALERPRDPIQDAIAVLLVNAERLTDAHLVALHDVFRAALMGGDGFPVRHVDLIELEADLQAAREFEPTTEPDFVESDECERKLDERDRARDMNAELRGGAL